MKSLSCARLLATPWTAAYQAPPSEGFSRQEYWSGVPSPSLEKMGTGVKIWGYFLERDKTPFKLFQQKRVYFKDMFEVKMGNKFSWNSSKIQHPGMGQAPRMLGWEGGPGSTVTPGAPAGVQGLQAPVAPVPPCRFPSLNSESCPFSD